LEEIRRNGTKEQEVIQALEKDNGLSWKEDGIVYMEGRIYIPNNRKLKEKILQENHDSVDVEHPGQQRMLELIKKNYWWPGLKEDIKKYIQGCFKCQQNKVQHQKKSGELYPLEILQGLWQEISIDIIGPLSRSNGMDGCDSGHCRPVHEDDLTKGDNNEHIIRRNCQNLQRQHLEITWNTKENSQ